MSIGGVSEQHKIGADLIKHQLDQQLVIPEHEYNIFVMATILTEELGYEIPEA